MPPKTIQLTETDSAAIRARREMQHDTVEEAAVGAGVGSDTWRRWEAGGTVRADKLKGLLSYLTCSSLDALRDWYESALGNPDGLSPERRADELAAAPRAMRNAWATSPQGELEVLLLIAGTEILGDHLTETIRELTRMPSGSHAGQINALWNLPEKWSARYDLEFVHNLADTVDEVTRDLYGGGVPSVATPAHVAAVALIVDEGISFFESMEYPAPWDESIQLSPYVRSENDDTAEDQAEWRDEFIARLTHGMSLPFAVACRMRQFGPNSPIHPTHWFEPIDWAQPLVTPNATA